MRIKRASNTRFAYKVDKIFWTLILMFPVISWWIYLFSFNGCGDASSSPVSFWTWMNNQVIIADVSNNVVYVTLYSIFSASGVFPVFGPSFLLFMAYLVNVEIIHVCFDVIVFIPRLAHKWISKAVQDD